jgi:hypothetical protein
VVGLGPAASTASLCVSLAAIVQMRERDFEDFRSCHTYYNRVLFVNVVKNVTGCVIVLCAVCTRKSRKLKRSYQVVYVSFTVQEAVGCWFLLSGRSKRQQATIAGGVSNENYCVMKTDVIRQSLLV